MPRRSMLLPNLRRRERCECERVDAVRLHQIGERGIDTALTLDATLPLERSRDETHAEMRFTTGTRTGMTSMLCAVVFDDEL